MAALIFLQVPTAGAQSTISFPEMPVDARTARVQNQAEEVFTRGNYKRAFFIYRNELTPIGDKYGQYMVGYMLLTGKGVEQDVVAASAWYRLAAERGTPELAQVRDELYASLDAEQRTASDRQFIELRKKYGDLVLLARAVEKDYEILRSRTGSRLGTNSGSQITVVPDRGASLGVDYYGQVERRMKARLAYIAKHTSIDIEEIDSTNSSASKVEERVVAALDHLD